MRISFMLLNSAFKSNLPVLSIENKTLAWTDARPVDIMLNLTYSKIGNIGDIWKTLFMSNIQPSEETT